MKYVALSMFFSLLVAVTGQCKDVAICLSEKSETLAVLRAFRDSVNRYPLAEGVKSLQQKINKLISYINGREEEFEAPGVKSYFEFTLKAFGALTETSDKNSMIKAVNDDIDLKFGSGDPHALQLQSTVAFDVSTQIKITAYVGGSKIAGGNYRIYWTHYLGGEVEKLILANAFVGSSDSYVNPYLLEIGTPGYFTFWLKDEQNQRLYKPSFNYKIITKNTAAIDINFNNLSK